jgi:nitrate/nitrite transporter NarK
MMTLTYALLAVAAFFLWWRNAEWGWAAVLVALALGIVIFVGDVDFSQNLGIRL